MYTSTSTCVCVALIITRNHVIIRLWPWTPSVSLPCMGKLEICYYIIVQTVNGSGPHSLVLGIFRPTDRRSRLCTVQSNRCGFHGLSIRVKSPQTAADVPKLGSWLMCREVSEVPPPPSPPPPLSIHAVTCPGRRNHRRRFCQRFPEGNTSKSGMCATLSAPQEMECLHPGFAFLERENKASPPC